ncbi:unnamed protein product [Pleuronectes platessa]|uniref:Uncharacterized protein n=1 Tax=Pleuronectes platessa TaxID=8262 RepID=A0A9N7YVI9_PLEPL|nr:unnamed protein product [Pleuronectes platessa]
MREAIRLKKEAIQSCLAQRSAAAADRYPKAKRDADPVVLETNTWVEKEFRETDESGDAPGVDVTHKEVKRDSAGRRPRESNTTVSTAKVTHLHCYTLTDILPEVTQLVGIKIPNTELAGFNNLWVWRMTRSSRSQQQRPG